jgi:hypothetical protein
MLLPASTAQVKAVLPEKLFVSQDPITTIQMKPRVGS